MKEILKLSTLGIMIAVLISKWQIVENMIFIDDMFIEDLNLLIKLGSMIGYTVFIAFAFFIQQNQIKDVLDVDRTKGLFLYSVFIIISVLFLSFIVINFSVQMALINLMVYLIIVSIVDCIGEKIILTINHQQSHHKSII